MHYKSDICVRHRHIHSGGDTKPLHAATVIGYCSERLEKRLINESGILGGDELK